MNKPQIICDKCQKNLPLSESDISHDARFGRKISPMELKFIIIHIKSCGADSFTIKHNNQIQKMTPKNRLFH